MTVGIRTQLLGLRGLRPGLLLGGAGPMLLLTRNRVFAIQRPLPLLGVPPQLSGLGELPAVVASGNQCDERDDDDHRDHPDDDPHHRVHCHLLRRGQVSPRT